MAAVLVAAVSPVLVAAVAVCWSLCGLLVLPAVLVITVVDDSFFYSSKQVKKNDPKREENATALLVLLSVKQCSVSRETP
jgi:hypothetical protein